ncbi:YjcZ family sporulation protein [Psychrobacillus sp. NPDC096389]
MRQAVGGYGNGSGFALIIVLFILLIIIGASFLSYGGGGYC